MNNKTKVLISLGTALTAAAVGGLVFLAVNKKVFPKIKSLLNKSPQDSTEKNLHSITEKDVAWG